jgi:2-polyprenyl-6-methoxyphenol hydroxylase-like FAD-dependent oxidoreductase
MTTTDYDVITVGGGLGGASLAKAMAERGYRVLVVEREAQFKDRVRGEVVFPWGCAEAQALGIYDVLREKCGHEPQFFDVRVGPGSLGVRDLAETTPQKLRQLCFYHPAMQQVLLEAAENAGAEVRRSARVRGVQPGSPPTVTIDSAIGSETLAARLVVGADGRGSKVRKWGGFDVSVDAKGLQLSGVLLDNVDGIDDRCVNVLNPFVQRLALLFPQGDGRVRAYFGNREDSGLKLSGDKDIPRFFEECIASGAPAELYENAKQAGPLATFPCKYEWVEHPYSDGVALVGDAATTSDQTWGQGLSLTLGATRRLRDALVENDDWDKAGHTFAAEVSAMWTPMRTLEFWYTEMFMGVGKEADALRSRALPLMAQDATRIPDHFNSGPDLSPINETARRRFFGEE